MKISFNIRRPRSKDFLSSLFAFPIDNGCHSEDLERFRLSFKQFLGGNTCDFASQRLRLDESRCKRGKLKDGISSLSFSRELSWLLWTTFLWRGLIHPHNPAIRPSSSSHTIFTSNYTLVKSNWTLLIKVCMHTFDTFQIKLSQSLTNQDERLLYLTMRIPYKMLE